MPVFCTLLGQESSGRHAVYPSQRLFASSKLSRRCRPRCRSFPHCLLAPELRLAYRVSVSASLRFFEASATLPSLMPVFCACSSARNAGWHTVYPSQRLFASSKRPRRCRPRCRSFALALQPGIPVGIPCIRLSVSSLLRSFRDAAVLDAGLLRLLFSPESRLTCRVSVPAPLRFFEAPATLPGIRIPGLRPSMLIPVVLSNAGAAARVNTASAPAPERD